MEGLSEGSTARTVLIIGATHEFSRNVLGEPRVCDVLQLGVNPLHWPSFKRADQNPVDAFLATKITFISDIVHLARRLAQTFGTLLAATGWWDEWGLNFPHRLSQHLCKGPRYAAFHVRNIFASKCDSIWMSPLEAFQASEEVVYVLALTSDAAAVLRGFAQSTYCSPKKIWNFKCKIV